jgi:cytochrome d ubiquinol oxidase subunit II
MVLVSGAAGVATLALVWSERPKLARFAAAAAVGAVIVAWAYAQKPYLLPGQLTLDQAAAPDSTLTALLISMAIGMVFLVPSLWWLYRLVLQGRLDQEVEPLDQRFRP